MRVAMAFLMALVAGSGMTVALKRADLQATVDGLSEEGDRRFVQVAFNKKPS